MRSGKSLAVGLLKWLCWLALPAFSNFTLAAGDFGVSPLRIVLSQVAKSTVVQLTNNGNEDVLIQTQAVNWGQADGVDQYQPTEEILVSPPIFTIPAKGKQNVRVGLLRKPDATRELTYRLFLEEVPQARGEADGVGFALRIGLPVFVAPVAKKAAPVIEWHADPGEPGKIRLTAKNAGTAHWRGQAIKLVLAKGITLLEKQLDGYLLAGQARSWELEHVQPWSGEALQVVLDTGELITIPSKSPSQ